MRLQQTRGDSGPDAGPCWTSTTGLARSWLCWPSRADPRQASNSSPTRSASAEPPSPITAPPWRNAAWSPGNESREIGATKSSARPPAERISSTAYEPPLKTSTPACAPESARSRLRPSMPSSPRSPPTWNSASLLDRESGRDAHALHAIGCQGDDDGDIAGPSNTVSRSAAARSPRAVRSAPLVSIRWDRRSKPRGENRHSTRVGRAEKLASVCGVPDGALAQVPTPGTARCDLGVIPG